MATVELSVNGTRRAVSVTDPDEPLLYVLRGELGLKAAKFGCGLGQCGACTVLIDGQAVPACQMPVGAIGTQAIVTLEGLGTPEAPHAIQAAFIAEQAAQCGYCSNGMMMTGAALLAANPHADDAAVRAALVDNLCRCGAHDRIVRAVLRAGGGI